MIEPKLQKINDYTLSSKDDEFYCNDVNAAGLRTVFNFKSLQVITLYESWLTQHGAAQSSQMVVQKFSELESLNEVNEMAEELKKLGGNPQIPEGGFQKSEDASEYVDKNSFIALATIVADLAARSEKPQKKTATQKTEPVKEETPAKLPKRLAPVRKALNS